MERAASDEGDRTVNSGTSGGADGGKDVGQGAFQQEATPIMIASADKAQSGVESGCTEIEEAGQEQELVLRSGIDVDRELLYSKLWEEAEEESVYKEDLEKSGKEVDDKVERASEADRRRLLNEKSVIFMTNAALSHLAYRQSPAKRLRDLPSLIRKFVARQSVYLGKPNEFGLAGCRWRPDEMLINSFKPGSTLDLIDHFEVGNAVVLHDLEEAAGKFVDAPWRQEESGFRRLAEAPEEQLYCLLNSNVLSFESPKDDQTRKRLLSSTVVGPRERASLSKNWSPGRKFEQLVGECRMPNVARAGPLQAMKLCELLGYMVEAHGEALERDISTAGYMVDVISRGETLNAILFRLNIGGTIKMKLVTFSAKTYHIYMECLGYSCTIHIRINAEKVLAGRTITAVSLEVLAEVRLLQQKILDVFSSCSSSSGSVVLPLGEIIELQDAVWEPLIAEMDLDAMDETGNYSLANIADLIPLLAFAGVKPEKTDVRAITAAWEVAVNRLCAVLCDFSGALKTPMMRAHLSMTLATGLAITSSMAVKEEAIKFLVQFMLWARVGATGQASSLSDFSHFGWRGYKHSEQITGYGAQVLWAACALLEAREVTKIGYKYLPDILIYNYLTEGKVGVKVLRMGFWLSAALNSGTDFEREDADMVIRSRKLGFLVTREDELEVSKCLSVVDRLNLMLRLTIDWAQRMRFPAGEARFYRYSASAASILLASSAFPEEHDVEDSNKIMSELIDNIGNELKASSQRGLLDAEDASLLHLGIMTEMDTEISNAQLAVTSDVRIAKLQERVEYVVSRAEKGGEKEKTSSEGLVKVTSSANVAASRKALLACSERTRSFFEQSRRFNLLMSGGAQHLEQGNLAPSLSVLQSRAIMDSSMGQVPFSLLCSTMKSAETVAMEYRAVARDVSIASASVAVTPSVSGRPESATTVSTSLSMLDGVDISIGYSFKIDLKRVYNNIVKMAAVGGQCRNKHISAGVSINLVEYTDHDVHNGVNNTVVIDSSPNDDLTLGRIFKDLSQVFNLAAECEGNADAVERMLVRLCLMPCELTSILMVIARYSLDAADVLVRRVNETIKRCCDEGKPDEGKRRFRVAGGVKAVASGAGSLALFPVIKALDSARATLDMGMCANLVVIVINFKVAQLIWDISRDIKNCIKVVYQDNCRAGLVDKELSPMAFKVQQAIFRDQAGLSSATQKICWAPAIVSNKAVRQVAATANKLASRLKEVKRKIREQYSVFVSKMKVVKSMATWAESKRALLLKQMNDIMERVIRRKRDSRSDDSTVNERRLGGMASGEALDRVLGVGEKAVRRRLTKIMFGIARSVYSNYRSVVKRAIGAGDYVLGMFEGAAAMFVEFVKSIREKVASTTRKVAKKLAGTSSKLKDMILTRKAELARPGEVNGRSHNETRRPELQGENLAELSLGLSTRPDEISVRASGKGKEKAAPAKSQDASCEDEEMMWQAYLQLAGVISAQFEAEGNTGTSRVFAENSDEEGFVEVEQTGAKLSIGVAGKASDYMAGTVSQWIENNKKKEEKKKKATRMAGVNLVSEKEIIERELKRHISLCSWDDMNEAFIDLWTELGDDVVVDKRNCGGQIADEKIVICGKRLLVRHGGARNEETGCPSASSLFAVDLPEATIVSFPSKGPIVMTDKMALDESLERDGGESVWSVKPQCESTVFSPVTSGCVLSGISCMLENKSTGEEVAFVPGHSWHFGNKRNYSKGRDSIVAVGVASARSAIAVDARCKDTTALRNLPEPIVAINQYDLGSERVSAVTVDCKNWKGRSGSPIVDRKGRFLGLLFLQLTVDGSYDAFKGLSVLIVDSLKKEDLPVLTTSNLKIVNCGYCYDDVEEDGEDVFLSGDDNSLQSEDIGTRLVGNKERAQGLKEEEKKKSPTKGLVNRLRNWCNKVTDESGAVAVEATGALEDACMRVRANSKNFRVDKPASDSDVIASIRDLVHIGGSVRLSSLTRVVLAKIHDNLLTGKTSYLCFVESAAMIALCSVLANIKVRHSVVRSFSAYKASLSASEKNDLGSWVHMLCAEDVSKWVSCNAITSLGPNYDRCTASVVKPDGDVDSAFAAVCTRFLLLSLNEVEVLAYNQRPVSGELNSVDLEVGSGYFAAGHAGRNFAVGNMTCCTIISPIVDEVKTYVPAATSDQSIIKCAVFSLASTPAELQSVKVRAANTMSMDPIAVVSYHASQWSLSTTWEVVRTCETVIWCSSLPHDKNEGLKTCIKFCRTTTEETAMMLSDCLKIASVMNQEDLADYLARSSFTCYLDREKPLTLGNDALEILGRDNCMMVKQSFGSLLAKMKDLIVSNCVVFNGSEDLEVSLAELTTDTGIRASNYTQSDVLSERSSLEKTRSEPLMSSVSRIISSAVERLTLCRSKVEIYITRLVKKAAGRLRDRRQTIKQSLKSALRKIRRTVLRLFRTAVNKLVPTGQFGRKTEQNWVLSLATFFMRGSSIAACAAAMTSWRGKNIPWNLRKGNAVVAFAAWALLEMWAAIGGEKISTIVTLAGDVITIVTNSAMLYAYVTGVAVCVKVGHATIMFNENYALQLSSVIGMLMNAGLELPKKGVQIQCTAELVYEGGRHGYVGVVLDTLRACLYFGELLYKNMLKLNISGTLHALWEGIKARTESSLKQNPTIHAVPCSGFQVDYSGAILAAAGTLMAAKFARWRASRSASAIGVLTDKKHAADVIDVYLKDRQFLTGSLKLVNCASGLLMLWSGSGKLKRILGGLIAIWALADATLKETSLSGLSYEFNTAFARTLWSENKLTTLASSVSCWLTGNSTVGAGLNAIIITGDSITGNASQSGGYDEGEVTTMCLEEQVKEEMMNRILMDFTRRPEEAYRCCKVLMGSDERLEDFDDLERWDVDQANFSEQIDLVSIASSGENAGTVGEETVVPLGRLTRNQMRYIGRTRKLILREEKRLWEEKESSQRSAWFLDERLWRPLVGEALGEAWEAAKDSRKDVLFALAERNDVPPILDVRATLIGTCCAEAGELVKDILRTGVVGVMNSGPMDWWSILQNANEKSTAGIITRMRDKTILTAGYVGDKPQYCEAAKEMILHGADRPEMHVINVFAKRRIEKKKISRLTGVSCVVTRTIQANEAAVKLAVMEAYLSTDKVLKLTRRRTGIAIGMNFFLEYAEDDLNTIVDSMLLTFQGLNVIRIALDHSSFDASQRNWSIRLAQEVRKALVRRWHDRSGHGVSDALKYIDRCYKWLKLRTMVTTSGDIFALTGQQMSGHATTSSDNSMKSLIYARSALKNIPAKEQVRLMHKSLRVQGDDTKFNLEVPIIVENEDMKQLISESMRQLGQNVRPEKMSTGSWNEGIDFLSHKTKAALFVVEAEGRRWMEWHRVPHREGGEILGMCATTLKQSSVSTTRKTSSDVFLMASKATSFGLMYGTDCAFAYICIAICWAASKILSSMRKFNKRMTINQDWLPWLVAQSGIAEEFALDIEAMSTMHGISRPILGIGAKSWMIIEGSESEELMDKVTDLQRKFCELFPRVGNWEWGKLNSAFERVPIAGGCGLKEVSMEKVQTALKNTWDPIVVVTAGDVSYKPYCVLKMRARESATTAGKMRERSRLVFMQKKEELIDETMDALAELLEIERWTEEEGNVLSDDGIKMTLNKAMAAKMTTGQEAWLVRSEAEALALEAKAWNMFEVVNLDRDGAEELVGRGVFCTAKVSAAIMCDERSTRSLSLDRLSEIKKDEGNLDIGGETVTKEALWARSELTRMTGSGMMKLIIADKE